MNSLSHTLAAGRSFQVYGLTDIGCVRDHNEDDYRICYDLNENMWGHSPEEGSPLGAKGALLILADGMGGAEAGEVASRIAVEGIRQYFSLTAIEDQISEESVRKHLQAAFNKVYEELSIQASHNPMLARMGTTLTVAWIFPEMLYLSWIGDSRAYLYNPNGIRDYDPTYYMDCSTKLRILTEDHSLVWEKVKQTQGRYTREEARLSGESNIIMRCLGNDHHHEVPDITGPIHLSSGDMLLLCSDGLNSMLSDSQLEAVFDPKNSLSENCHQLVSAANKAGGRDNITVILSSFVDNAGLAPEFLHHKKGFTISQQPVYPTLKQGLNKKPRKKILLVTVIFLFIIITTIILTLIRKQTLPIIDKQNLSISEMLDSVSNIHTEQEKKEEYQDKENPKESRSRNSKPILPNNSIQTIDNHTVDSINRSNTNDTSNVKSNEFKDKSDQNKLPRLSEHKQKQNSKFLNSNKVIFEMTNCFKDEKSIFNSAPMERTVREGLFYYEFNTKKGYRAFRLACNEKEISIEIEKYSGKMEVEYFLHEGKKQKDESDDFIRIKSIKLKEKDRLRLIDELNK
ncbi:MAG: serine/threonine-protein phosphatase [Saprospiraceae bacterium]|nr:serine/threonine-protein phosphatase [Candidatus Vicinibacter affinis]